MALCVLAADQKPVQGGGKKVITTLNYSPRRSIKDLPSQGDSGPSRAHAWEQHAHSGVSLQPGWHCRLATEKVSIMNRDSHSVAALDCCYSLGPQAQRWFLPHCFQPCELWPRGKMHIQGRQVTAEPSEVSTKYWKRTIRS